MMQEEFPTEELSTKIREILGPVQDVFRRETGELYDERFIEDSIRTCVSKVINRLSEDLLEMFTSPARREYQELAGLLEKEGKTVKAVIEVEEAVALAREFNDESVFDGFRPFSSDKLAAMIEYLTGKGKLVYKTSLNKLLFYSDLTYFFLRNRGMSGSVYYNRPHGPVADAASPVVDELIRNGRIDVDIRTKALKPASEPALPDTLTKEERKVLDWVVNTYGSMSAGEISGVSHTEMAYRYTDPNEPIAYAYGKFFKKLPPSDLIGDKSESK